LAQGDADVIDAIKGKVLISINTQHSHAVGVVGHHDCAANPGSKEDHVQHVTRAVKVVTAWGLGVPVVGLFVNEYDWIDVIVDVPPGGTT